jgi:hypothetical protein
MDGAQNSSTVVGYSNCLSRVFVAHTHEDLVHALGPECGLDQVGNSDRSNKGLLQAKVSKLN